MLAKILISISTVGLCQKDRSEQEDLTTDITSTMDLE